MNFFAETHRKYHIVRKIIPDEPEKLLNIVEDAIEERAFDILITTGGTGIGSRDITPETLSKYIDKELPGIMEMIRVKYGDNNPNALLSRSVAGVKGSTLIYALPGSKNAVQEYLEVILPTLHHSLYMIHDLDVHG